MAALRLLDSLVADITHFIMEADLVSLGYSFLYRQSAQEDAVQVLEALTELFPDSSNAWDCFGEASAEAWESQMVIDSYRRPLDLNPENDHAAGALSDLERR